MLDGLLKGKFFNKCKLAARMTKARLDMIKKKRTAMHKFLKNDLGDLLKNGLDKNAYDRAEGYLVEQNMTSCYELVEKFCCKILDNVEIMSKQSECPQNCNEAVSSLIYAAARFADLPDLRELRKLFTERYGTSLDSYVNKELVNKLKLVPPTKDMKFRLLQHIADELGVQWDRNAAEEKLFKQVNNGATDNEFRAHRDAKGSPKSPEERTPPFRNFPREGKKEVDQTRNNDRQKPGSVRRIRSKIEYDEDDVGASSARKAEQDSNHNKPDEEERMLDKMLLRHSLKKSTLFEMESDQKSGRARHGTWDVGTSKEGTKKVPDYDDLVARLTAFKEDR